MTDILKIASARDVFQACCFRNEHDQTADTVIGIATGNYVNETDIEPNVRTIFNKTNLKFYKSGNSLEVDLIFRSPSDPNLIRTLSLLEDFRVQNAAYYMTEEENSCPSLQFVLTPLVLKGRYQVILADPELFALCSKNPKEYPDMIKLIFTDDNILILEQENLDYNKLMAQAKRQNDMEDFLMAEEEKKKQRDAYEASVSFNKVRGNSL